MSVRPLLRAKRRQLINTVRSEGGIRRAIGIVLFALAFWFALFAGADWFVGRVLAIEPIGVVMVRRLLQLVLLFVFAILSFSSLIAAFSTYYLADDLHLLVPKPIAPYALFTARFAENTIGASWATLAFSTSFFAAIAHAMDAPIEFWGALGVVLVALAIIPSSLATVVSLLLTFPFSARRARQVLIFAATAGFAIAFVLFRNLEPERFLNPDERAPMLEALSAVQGTDPWYLPSTWALESLWVHLGPGASVRHHPLALLATASAASFFVAGWCFRALHFRAFSKAQEGLDLREQLGGAGTSANGRRSAAELAQRLADRPGRATPTRALLNKDGRTLVRDTAQWSQLLLIAALVVIYVVNFKYIRSIGDTGIISANGLHFTNIALAGFVAVAVCVRFGFPAVSLEGRAFWLILRAPIELEEFLRAKWLGGAVPLVVMIDGLAVLTSWWLGSGWLLTTLAAVTLTPMTIGLFGLALGLGARHPRFGIDNAAKIATGIGGVLYMMSGLAMLLACVIGSALPTLTLSWWMERGLEPTPGRVAASAALTLVVLLGPLWLGRRSVLRGAKQLRARGLG
jgi:ABC-2 type transport system permease protein